MTQRDFRMTSREVMTLAWRTFKVTGEKFADCLKRAWQVVKLKVAMKTRIVRFYYIKKSTGELRQAFGTLDPHRYEYEPKGGRTGSYADCVQYWDTEKGGFRMFKSYNLVRVEL